MSNEDKKDFNAMLHDSKDMPKFQIITDQKSIEKYGGNKMYFAPPINYDKVMKQIPYGKVITVGKIREYFAKLNGADFTDPITAGIFVSIAAWACSFLPVPAFPAAAVLPAVLPVGAVPSQWNGFRYSGTAWRYAAAF